MASGKKQGGGATGRSSGKPSGKQSGKVAKLPKKKCCVSKDRCSRCPIRMLKEGTLPEGYTVRKRKLVKVGNASSGAGRKKQKQKKAA